MSHEGTIGTIRRPTVFVSPLDRADVSASRAASNRLITSQSNFHRI